MTRNLIALAGAALLLSACAHAPVAMSDAGLDGSLTPQARWEKGQDAYRAWNAKRYGWTTTASGLQYKRIVSAPDASPRPSPGDTVKIHYTGTFIDGREFDSSRARGEPATFPLPRLIKGWQEGVPLMRVGERFLFVIPGELAYGDRYRDPIPANSTLLFDIQLIDLP